MLSDITISHSIKHSRFNFSIFFISSILYNIPKFLEFEWSEVRLIQKYFSKIYLYTLLMQNGLVETSLRSNKAYTIYYIFWSKFLVVELVPYLTILILNIRIIKKIYKSNQFRRRFNVSWDLLLNYIR